MAKYYCSPPEPQKRFCETSLFLVLKFVVKSVSILLLVIAFLKTLYNLVNQLNDIRDYMQDIKCDEQLITEAQVMACAQHMLYVSLLLMATFGVFTEKYLIVLLFSTINAILNVSYIWSFTQILFLWIDFLIVLFTFILSLILYKQPKN